MTTSKVHNSDKKLQAADKQKQAMQLRLRGKQYDEIAEIVGYATGASAYNAVMAALKATLREPAEELRQMEVKRIDVMLDKLWQSIEAWDTAEPSATKQAVVDRILRLMERRAKYLGLDVVQEQKDQVIKLVFESDSSYNDNV